MILEKVQVELITGTGKNGREYNMLKIITGDKDLDYALKPIFLSTLEIRALNDIIKK